MTRYFRNCTCTIDKKAKTRQEPNNLKSSYFRIKKIKLYRQNARTNYMSIVNEIENVLTKKMNQINIT